MMFASIQQLLNLDVHGTNQDGRALVIRKYMIVYKPAL